MQSRRLSPGFSEADHVVWRSKVLPRLPRYIHFFGRDRFLDAFGVFVEDVLASRNDFRDDRKAVGGRSLRKDGSVTPLLDLVLKIASLWDRHRGGLRPVLCLGFARHLLALPCSIPQGIN